jgi:hypothetical protein
MQPLVFMRQEAGCERQSSTAGNCQQRAAVLRSLPWHCLAIDTQVVTGGVHQLIKCTAVAAWLLGLQL